MKHKKEQMKKHYIILEYNIGLAAGLMGGSPISWWMPSYAKAFASEEGAERFISNNKEKGKDVILMVVPTYTTYDLGEEK